MVTKCIIDRKLKINTVSKTIKNDIDIIYKTLTPCMHIVKNPNNCTRFMAAN